MFKFFKKNRTPEYKVTWKFIGEDEIYKNLSFSAGLASLDADPMVEILSIEKM